MMLSERYVKIIIDIINKYGEKAQILQSIEEMSELTKELLKNINRNENNEKEIIQEIADVIVMITQLVMIYKIDVEKIYGAIEYKLERQEKRMNNEKNKDLNCMSD